MDKKLVDLAKQAGFPVNETGGAYSFSVQEKAGIFGSNELELDSKIQKLADLLTTILVERHRRTKTRTSP